MRRIFSFSIDFADFSIALNGKIEREKHNLVHEVMA